MLETIALWPLLLLALITTLSNIIQWSLNFYIPKEKPKNHHYR